jgi:hypothetical protein
MENIEEKRHHRVMQT